MQPAAPRSPPRWGETRFLRTRLVWLTVPSVRWGETGTLPSSRPTALDFQRYILPDPQGEIRGATRPDDPPGRSASQAGTTPRRVESDGTRPGVAKGEILNFFS